MYWYFCESSLFGAGEVSMERMTAAGCLNPENDAELAFVRLAWLTIASSVVLVLVGAISLGQHSVSQFTK